MATNDTNTTVERLDDKAFADLITRMRKQGVAAENLIQHVFMACWHDLGASRSCKRLNIAWAALEGSPHRAQFSTAIRALSGEAHPVKDGQKWQRTGIKPLTCDAKTKTWSLSKDDDCNAALEANWTAIKTIHFRAVKIATSKTMLTWTSEMDPLIKRIRKASDAGLIHPADAKKFTQLLGEIERINAQ